MMLLAMVAAAVYLVRTALFRAGIARARRRATPAPPAMPVISVVVAARNEARTIDACLQALVRQEYPTDRYEVIVMDDGSSDETAAIAARHAARSPRIRCLAVQAESSGLRGKARAVAQGFDAARGELLVTTDADCRVPPRWLAAIASYMDTQTGAVAGFTLQDADTLFGAVQSVDWSNLQSMACAGVGLGSPLGCIGNNLAFRREAYEGVGGYRGFRFSVTEDFALFDEVYRTRRWRTKYPMDPAALVWSAPCPDVRTLWRQKHRWLVGGRRLGLRGYLVLVATALYDGSLIAAIATGAAAAILVLVAARWIADASLIAPTLRRLGAKHLLWFFIPYEVYAFVYEVCIPFGLLNGRVQWKGRTY